MPKISVLVPTMRVGGLDILFNSLAKQTFKDFEVILSDCLYQKRFEIVDRKAKELGLVVKHVEPKDNKFPENFFCRCANTTISNANGELAVMFADYTWVPPQCLFMHDSWHQSNTNTCLMGTHKYLHLPSLKREFHYKVPSEVYSDSAIGVYAEDLQSGKLDDTLWSIFSKEFTTIDGLVDDNYSHDPKVSLPSGFSESRYFYAKNDSIKLRDLIEINGWDESMDESHGYQDWEIADRLTARLGTKWYSNSNSNFMVSIINPRNVFPHGKRLKPFSYNESIWAAKVASGNWNNPNNWVLK